MDLSSYSSIQSNLFVRVQVDYYKATPTATASSQILRFSDLRTNYVIDGETYIGLGNLMGVSSASSELRPSNGELSISISGIPNTSIYEIINSRIKGCPVRIYRGLFDANSGTALSITGNPMTRYRGFVNNYSLNEEYDIVNRTSSNTITLICNSSVDVLQNKIVGRRTNPAVEKRFYPNDLAMDRVPTLSSSAFNFGAP